MRTTTKKALMKLANTLEEQSKSTETLRKELEEKGYLVPPEPVKTSLAEIEAELRRKELAEKERKG